MATVVHEQIFLSSSGIRSAIFPATNKSSQGVSLSITGKVGGGLAEFKGLKIQYPSKAFLSPRRCGVSHKAGGRIVCEAQGSTVVDVPTVNDATWKSLVLNADEPVLVEFWAPWCGPCRIIHPVIGELASEYDGKLKCFKLSTDESPSIATQYGVRSVPTTMIFRKGEKKESIIGAVPKTTLSTIIEKFL